MKKEQRLDLYANLIRYDEDREYQTALLSSTIFPYLHLFTQAECFKAILNFSLKEIGFNKKKALVFFLAVELLTNQKCVATLSSKNVLAWKLRKGALVGCKVTLRKKNLADFFDTIALALPRMESFKGVSPIKRQGKSLFKNKIQTLGFPLKELVMFYPIELGLGINTEVKKADFQITFSTYNPEEQIFILTNSKIPLI